MALSGWSRNSRRAGLVDTVSHLSQALDQTVVVENRAGSDGLVGTDYVPKRPTDGYIPLVSHASVLIYATATRTVMPFDPVNDFSHMGMLFEAPMVQLVPAQSPFQTLAQYLTGAKTRPLCYGWCGIGYANHLFSEMLTIQCKAPNHDHIPYHGSAPAMQDLLDGQIDSVLDPFTTNVAQLKAGSLRALAVSTPNRLPFLPSIPTFAEMGFPKLTGSQWLGLSALKGLPTPIVQRLLALIPEILTKPGIAARLKEMQTLPRQNAVVVYQFTQLINALIDTWRILEKLANVAGDNINCRFKNSRRRTLIEHR